MKTALVSVKVHTHSGVPPGVAHSLGHLRRHHAVTVCSHQLAAHAAKHAAKEHKA